MGSGGEDSALNKVEICGVNTAKLPVLNNKEMRKMFVRMLEGDKEAREKLVNGNLRLVLSVIQRFNNRGELVDDLFQVGCIGLIKAIDNFDLSQNVKFSTYAVPMIIGEIRRYLRDNTPVRVSRSLRDIAYKVLQVRDQLAHKHSREPTLEEIAAELTVSREEIILALDSIQELVSLNPFIMTVEILFTLWIRLAMKNQDENGWRLSPSKMLCKSNDREN